MSYFVIGDIHGRHKALTNVLTASGFDYTNDVLITLGDIVDGGKDTRKCIDELLKIEHIIPVLGNHDIWALNWMRTGFELQMWVSQGGMATMRSYSYNYKKVPQEHIDFLASCCPYHIDTQNRVFVHGGFNPNTRIELQETEFLVWDRDLINHMLTGGTIMYDHAFIGHTTTQLINGDTKPLTIDNLTLMDTGGGWNGKLTTMNIDTGEYWQSEKQKSRKWV